MGQQITNRGQQAHAPDILSRALIDFSFDGASLAANDSPGGLPFHLIDEEEMGGHGISEHVGKSERFLKDYVRSASATALAEGWLIDGTAKGSFTSVSAANRLINSTISQNRDKN